MAGIIAGGIGRTPDVRDVETDGAARAAALIAKLGVELTSVRVTVETDSELAGANHLPRSRVR